MSPSTSCVRPAAAPLPHAWSGRPDGDPLVLISGLGGKGRSWRPFDAAAGAHHRVLTFDLPGCGAAPALAGLTSIRDLAARVLDFFDALDLRSVRLVGRSMGGMIAQELAALAPERFSALVLVATTGHVDPSLSRTFRHWARLADDGAPAAERWDESMRWCLGTTALRDPAVRQRYLYRKSDADRPRDYARQARACAAHDARARLGAIAAPTLVVGGMEDRLMPPAHSQALANAIPRAELALIPAAGHLVYLESPTAFNARVFEFLDVAAPVRRVA